jgi:hypothetical protein
MQYTKEPTSSRLKKPLLQAMNANFPLYIGIVYQGVR